jgi:hypothetical protein
VGATTLTWSSSPDGLTWQPYDPTDRSIATNPTLVSGGSNNNPGFASLPDGSFDGATFAGYGSSYQPGWGVWHLYRTNFIVDVSAAVAVPVETT